MQALQYIMMLVVVLIISTMPNTNNESIPFIFSGTALLYPFLSSIYQISIKGRETENSKTPITMLFNFFRKRADFNEKVFGIVFLCANLIGFIWLFIVL